MKFATYSEPEQTERKASNLSRRERGFVSAADSELIRTGFAEIRWDQSNRLEVREMITIVKKLRQREGRALMLLTCITLLSGCAMVGPSKPPVTVGEVIQMSNAGTPAETIINKMRDSNAVYPLTAAQLAELHDMGVADRVLDYMQQTYIEEQRQEQNSQDWGGAMWPPNNW